MPKIKPFPMPQAEKRPFERPEWLWVSPDRKDHRRTWRDIPQTLPNDRGTMWFFLVLVVGAIVGFAIGFSIG